MFTVEEISLDNINEVKVFLEQFNLEYDNDIDYTIAVYDTYKLIGTASKHKDVLKCFAVLEEYQGLGIVNSLVKTIEDRMFKEGIYHFFVYTKSCNKNKFKSIGYKEIVTDYHITLLENGDQNINTYLNQLRKNYKVSNTPKACIIMNGNPFTLGHRYLVEKASEENEEVIVFVVSEDRSVFPFSTRLKLISEGVKDLRNVKVIETGPYLVSNASFPTYFIKDKRHISKFHASLDCQIFINYYKPIFNLNRRYVGTEPYCQVTKIYNEVMTELLPKNGVEVKEIHRLDTKGQLISASTVRELIKCHQYEKLKSFVPDTTYQFLMSEEAKNIIHALLEDSRH